MELKNYLMMYYSTKHSTTGKTPTELMYGRNIRTKLPSVEDVESTPIPADFRDADQIAKYKGRLAEDTRRKAKESSLKLIITSPNELPLK